MDFAVARWRPIAIAILFLILVAGLFFGCSSENPASQEKAKPANQWKSMLDDDPHNVDARVEYIHSLLGEGEFEKAERVADEGLRLDPDDPRILSAKSRVYTFWGDATQDPSYNERAEAICRGLIAMGEADHAVYARLGWLYRVKGEQDDAIEYFETAIRLAPDDVFALSQLGQVLYTRGRYEQALPMLEKSAELVAKYPERMSDPERLWNWIGDCQRLLGDYDAAITSMEKCAELGNEERKAYAARCIDYLELLRSTETGFNLVDEHVALAKWHAKLQRSDRAIAEYESALRAVPEPRGAEDAEPYLRRAKIHDSLARHYQTVGDIKSMIDNARQAVEALERTDDRVRLAFAYCVLGASLSGTMDNTSGLHGMVGLESNNKLGLEAYEKAEQIYVEIGDQDKIKSAQSGKLWLMARLYGARDPRCLSLRAEMMEGVPAEGDLLDRSQVDIVMREATYRGYEKDFAGALELLLRCKKYYDSIPVEQCTEFDARFYIDCVKRFNTERDDPSVCIPYLERALEITESLRNRMGSDKFKRGATGKQFQDATTRMAWTYTQLGDFEKAFEYGEQYKGRNLLDLLGTKGVESKERAVEERHAEQRTVLAKLEDLEQQVEQARVEGDGATLRSLERTLTIEQTRYERLKEDIGVADRELASFSEVEVTTLDEVQPLLKGITFVNYVLMPLEFNTAVIVTEDDVISVPLPDVHGRSLGPVIERFRNEIGVETKVAARDLSIEGDETPAESEAESSAPDRPAAQELYDLLVEPVKPYLKTKIVCISSCDVLNYVPFEALQDADGRYFIEDYAVVYAPSASVLKLCMEKHRLDKESVLALGNPNLRNPAFRLVHAEEEVKGLEGMFPKVDVFTFDNATESVVKAHGGEYDILHFACHGELNVDEPMLTSLRLAPDTTEDGYLHAGEIFDIDLAPSLVVLSACNSAVGELSTGNELMGLTRSFLYAGAPAIIASLWQVDDRSTAFLMGEFYRNLQTMSKAEALREAKLATMKEYPSPFHWAPFCLQGDYR